MVPLGPYQFCITHRHLPTGKCMSQILVHKLRSSSNIRSTLFGWSYVFCYHFLFSESQEIVTRPTLPGGRHSQVSFTVTVNLTSLSRISTTVNSTRSIPLVSPLTFRSHFRTIREPITTRPLSTSLSTHPGPWSLGVVGPFVITILVLGLTDPKFRD